MTGSTANCSTALPTSEIYFADISLGEKTGIILASAACIAVLGLFMDQVRFVLKKYKTGRGNPELKFKSLWLIGIYPAFSIMSLLAVFVPRAALLCDLAASIYLAVCLFHFTTLIIVYSGGIPSLLERVEDSLGGFLLRTPPFCCCCHCCPSPTPSWSNLRRIRLMVFQNTFVLPFVSFLTLVLWMDEKFARGQLAADKPGLYLAVIKMLSTGTAIYGLLILFWSCQGFLKSHSLRPKFLVMQVVLFLHNFQDIAFLLMSRSNIPPCSGRLSSIVRGDGIRHMVLVGEMFVLALLARILYRRPHQSHQNQLTGPPSREEEDLPDKTKAEPEAEHNAEDAKDTIHITL